MSISRDDALTALQDVERAEARSLDARVYSTSGIQLIGWGVVWMIGYGLTGLQPHWAGFVWPLLIASGVVFCFLVVRLRGGKGRVVGWRWAVTGLSVVLFFGATYAVFGVTSAAPSSAFPALVLAFVYAVVGGWRFTRFLVIAGAFVRADHAGLLLPALGHGFLAGHRRRRRPGSWRRLADESLR